MQINIKSEMKFCYWNCRGLGSAPRLLLRYIGCEYEDVVIVQNNSTMENWHSTKSNIGLDFPNLPYLIDGDVKLTQSHAILKYFGRKYGLSAVNEPEMAREEMILFQLHDLSQRIVLTAYHKSYKNEIELQHELKQLQTDLNVHLDLLERYFPSDNSTVNWFTGSQLSYVDFFAYEIIDRYRELVQRDCLEKFDKLNDFMKRFENLVELKAFLASDEYRKAPIYGPIAAIGNTVR